MDKALYTAVGVRDLFGEELREKRALMNDIRNGFFEAGYEAIETPAFEYFDVFGNEIGTTPSKELYKFFDREGETLVLRPDFTPSVARAVAMYFGDAQRPIRLCYEGNTFVNTVEYQGRLKEQTQMGIECIGVRSAEADAEVIGLLISSLKNAGLREFQVSIGEVNFFKSLVEKAGLNQKTTETLRSLISRKNFFGVEELLSSLPLEAGVKEALAGLPQLFGEQDVLDTALQYATDAREREAIFHLKEIADILEKKGDGKYISFDFGMLSKYRYYTGIIFSAFTYGSGEPIAKGGRYDRLLSYFGADDPAVGMVIQIGHLMNALRQGRGRTE